MNKTNYNLEYKKIAKQLIQEGRRPKLLLHACCAPCSSTCMEKVRAVFDLTVFFYNPNITNRQEYDKRVSELARLVDIYNDKGIGLEDKWLEYYGIKGDATDIEKKQSISLDSFQIKLIDGGYDADEFYRIAKGLENEPERGIRCHACYGQRLKKTAEVAKEGGYDFFATTLTLSPQKDEQILNSIGIKIADAMEVELCNTANSEKGYSTEAEKNKDEDGLIACEQPLWLPTDFKKEGGYQRSIELSREYNLYRQNYCGCEYSVRE